MESEVLHSSKAVIFSAYHFLKDGNIAVHPTAEAAAKNMQQAISKQLAGGLKAEDVVWLNNEPDFIKIKELIAVAAEQASNLLLIYIAGTAVLRRGQIYITLPHSTLQQIHVNGFSLQELTDIVREPEIANKLFILDCHFSGDTPDIAQTVREELHRHAAKLKKSFLMAQLWQEGREALGSQISRILHQGIKKQQEWLTLEDLCQELNEAAQRQRQPEPLMAAKKQTLTIAIAPNQRYQEFKRLFAEAQQAFEARNFDAALSAFLQAQALFPNDDATATHIRFINCLQEAEQHYTQKQYNPARRGYEAAFELIPVPFLLEKIERCTADLANQYFELQQYDQAKAAYARLASDHPHNSFYAERLRISTAEQRYHELIDKADNHYFRYEFVEALQAYREALAIHADAKTERRAQECQRYVDVLVYLQQKAEAEVRARLEEELQQKAELAVAERIAQLQKELTTRLEQEITQKVQQEYDAKVWDAALQSNQRAAVELYRTVFPQGAFIDQAEYWLNLYREPAHEPVATSSYETPTTSSPDYTTPVATEQETPLAYKYEPLVNVDLPEEKPKDEETLWNEALQKDTIEGYMEYISKTITAEHIADAYYRISRLRNATTNLEEQATSYYDSSKQATYPASPSYDSSETASFDTSFTYTPPPDTPTYHTNGVEQTEEELWRQAVVSNTQASYQNYLNHSVLLKYESEARRRIDQLQEEEKMQETLEWEKASAQDTLEAYKAYINKYPFGSYYAKARFRIARLESEIN
ncbi:MAG: hypothetical protein RMJ87_13580 [Cytophagales bacterium]|nr:hypothetical protein [Bernardetiaceae bacterium]MDW8206053.1 hypothetical protein [Cytophagales bacterium]